MKKLLSIILAILMVASTVPLAFAAESASGTLGFGSPLTWSLDTNGKLTISGTGAMPEYGYAQDTPWFSQYRDDITSVVVSEGITTVGRMSLSYLANLTSVTLPSTVTAINDGAFGGDVKLEEITIPKNVSTFGADVFYGCKGLKKINVDSASSYFKSVDGVLFSKDGKTLVLYPINKAGESYTVPAGTEKIGESAFSKNINLRNLVISDGVKTIVREAFTEAINLTTVTIPSTVTVIDSYAFADCTSLKTVTIADGVIRIGAGAFSGDTMLENLVIPSSAETIENHAFDGCKTVHYLGAESDVKVSSGNDSLHFTVHTEGTAATCVKTGVTDSYFCAECNKTIRGAEQLAIDKNAHNFDTTANKVRPVYNANTKTWADGYYEYTCANGCGETKKVYADDVKRADFTAYDKAVADIETILETYDLTDEGRQNIVDSLEGYIINENMFASEQKLVDNATRTLTDLHSRIEFSKDSYIKADFSEIDLRVATIDDLVKDFDIDDSLQQEIDSIKADLASYKASGESQYYLKNQISALISKAERIISYMSSCAEGNHIFFGYTSDGNGTCLEPGTESAYCHYGCGTKDTRPAKVTPHDYEYTEVEEATCEYPATYNGVCKNCGDVVKNVLIGEVGGHKLGEYYSDGNATCTEDGTKTATCIYCYDYKETVVDEGSARGHRTKMEAIIKQATCLSNAVLRYKCGYCEYTEEVEWEGSQLNHSFTEYVGVYKESTCSEEGLLIYGCEYGCGETEYVVNWSLKDHKGGTATCTQCAVCTVCEQVYGYINPANHNGNEKLVDYSPATCINVSISSYECSECKRTWKEYGAVEEMQKVECIPSDEVVLGVCTETHHYLSCSVCGSSCKEVPHTLGEASVYFPYNEYVGGEVKYAKHCECTGCGMNIKVDISYEEYLAATEGNPSDNCDHMCHKGGFMGFIWKIAKFFIKLFKTNPVCECGAAHY